MIFQHLSLMALIGYGWLSTNFGAIFHSQQAHRIGFFLATHFDIAHLNYLLIVPPHGSYFQVERKGENRQCLLFVFDYWLPLW
jgi:hypothetical protein